VVLAERENLYEDHTKRGFRRDWGGNPHFRNGRGGQKAPEKMQGEQREASFNRNLRIKAEMKRIGKGRGGKYHLGVGHTVGTHALGFS